jgi:hypothetical protein
VWQLLFPTTQWFVVYPLLSHFQLCTRWIEDFKIMSFDLYQSYAPAASLSFFEWMSKFVDRRYKLVLGFVVVLIITYLPKKPIHTHVDGCCFSFGTILSYVLLSDKPMPSNSSMFRREIYFTSLNTNILLHTVIYLPFFLSTSRLEFLTGFESYSEVTKN